MGPYRISVLIIMVPTLFWNVLFHYICDEQCSTIMLSCASCEHSINIYFVTFSCVNIVGTELVFACGGSAICIYPLVNCVTVDITTSL